MPDIFEVIYRTTATEGSPGTAPPPGSSTGLTQAQADDRYARRAQNLADLNSASSARSNLGLGDLAVLDQVDTPQIVGEAVTTAKLALNSVSTDRIQDNAVTLDKAVFANQNLLTTSHVTFASVTAGYLRTTDGNIRSDEVAVAFTNVAGSDRVSIAALNADFTGYAKANNFWTTAGKIRSDTSSISLRNQADSAFVSLALLNIKFHGDIESESFVEAAGLIDGFQVTQAGDLRTKSIRANELRVKAFVAEVSAALYGEDVLTKSRGVLSRNFTVPGMNNKAALYVEDLEGLEGMAVFEDEDYVRLRMVDRSGGGLIVADVWGKVDNYEDLGGGEQSWDFERLHGGSTGDVINAGSIAIDYGQSEDGVMLRTVLGDHSPRETIYTWETNPWTAANYTLRTQFGNLDGITGASGYGVYVQDRFYAEIGAINKMTIGRDAGGSGLHGVHLGTDDYWYGTKAFSFAGGVLQGTASEVFMAGWRAEGNLFESLTGGGAGIRLNSDAKTFALLTEGQYESLTVKPGSDPPGTLEKEWDEEVNDVLVNTTSDTFSDSVTALSANEDLPMAVSFEIRQPDEPGDDWKIKVTVTLMAGDAEMASASAEIEPDGAANIAMEIAAPIAGDVAWRLKANYEVVSFSTGSAWFSVDNIEFAQYKPKTIFNERGGFQRISPAIVLPFGGIAAGRGKAL